MAVAKYCFYLFLSLHRFRYPRDHHESGPMPPGDPIASSSVVPSAKRSRISPTQTLTLPLGLALRFGRKRRLNEPRYRLFWQTVAIVASMLIFAAIRPPTTEVTAGDTIQSTRRDPLSTELRTVSGTRSKQAEASNAAEAPRREPDHFVARDFTHHANQHARSIDIRKFEATRNEQSSVSHKRVVDN